MPTGPCIMCGSTNYPLSCGGPAICPACDCGVPPSTTRAQAERQQAFGVLLAAIDMALQMSPPEGTSADEALKTWAAEVERVAERELGASWESFVGVVRRISATPQPE